MIVFKTIMEGCEWAKRNAPGRPLSFIFGNGSKMSLPFDCSYFCLCKYFGG